MVVSIKEVRTRVSRKPTEPRTNTTEIGQRQGELEQKSVKMDSSRQTKREDVKTKVETGNIIKERETASRCRGTRESENRRDITKKCENLKLGDYLTLTSLTKRSEANRSKEKFKKPKADARESEGVQGKEKNVIDTITSIAVVREETKKELL
jgi:hypothetical protein